MNPLPPAEWGQDHLTTLLYLETCCVDYRGVIQPEKLRSRSYPANLRGGSLPEHSDLDCIEDMRARGLVEGGARNTFAAYNDMTGGHRNGPDPRKQPYAPFSLTPAGWRLAHLLRRRRASGFTDLPSVQEVEEAVRGSL